MKKPKVTVFSGYGLNCEEETRCAFELAGAVADIIHINDVIDGYRNLKNYQIAVIPGGFSYGDDTGSGNAYANRLKNHLWEALLAFIRRDTLMIGICNGFQILVNLGLLPALDSHYGRREVALVSNDSARYTVRWVDLQIANDTPWFRDIKTISLPIAHGEGKFYATEQIRKRLKKKDLIAARYVKGEICRSQSLAVNPNGSLDDIAAVTDESRRILGMMPHPERAIFPGKGLRIFQNAVNYFL